MKKKVNSFLNRKLKTPAELELAGIPKVALLQILVAAVSIIEIELCRQLLDALFLQDFMRMLICCALFVALRFLLNFTCRRVERCTASVRGEILTSLMRQVLKKNSNLRFVSNEDLNANDKMSIADGDCERYTDELLGRAALFSGLIATPCYIIYGFTINIWITLLIVVFSICMSFLNKKNKLKLYQCNEELNERYGVWANYLWKALDNLEVIKVFLAQKKIVREQRRRNDCLNETEQKSLKTYLRVCLVEESSDMIFTLLILCLSFFAMVNHQMSAASILAMVEALTAIQKNIFQLPEQMIKMHELESIASRIYKMESMEEDDAIEELSENFEKLTVKDASFCYEQDEILQGVNCTFEKGKFYILAGASGCGKSTLLRVLARLLPIKDGAVLWNQKDFFKMTRDSVYKKVMYISQNKEFLEDSIKENICLGETDEVAYQRALNDSFLQAVFDKRQCGDDQFLALSGWPLSSGERQMVSFANVLYMQKQLILLDEAFSAIDPAKEKHFYKKLKQLTENGATVILVSHRLTNFEMADCILFMENGQIKESGSLAQLCKENQNFSRWYSMNKEGEA